VVANTATPRAVREGGRSALLEARTPHEARPPKIAHGIDVSQYLPDRPRPKDVSGLRRNLRPGPDGRLHWHWDPKFLDSRLQDETGNPARFEDAAASVAVPMLLVRGGDSDVVGTGEADALLRVAPQAQAIDVAGAGHMVAGDRNDVFSSAVADLLIKNVHA
jgi:pimeloyl-ACP methyl ester carboxylesterase